MVKAVRVHETGGPGAMRIEDIDIPLPGRGEVVMRNHACGVNFIDVYFREGHYKAQLPFTLGNESAGEVIAVGKGVKNVKPGDRVAALSTFGGYAESRLVNADRLIRLPKSFSYEVAGAMLLKGLTAQYLLRQTFKVKKGHRVLIHAAAGGVGLILCQWAKALGAQVIGTVGTPEKAELAKKAGAKHVILYREEDFAARVRDITRGELCDVVYDSVGKATFPASLDCLRPLGMFVSFGSSSGPVDPFDIGLLATKGSLFATRPSLNTYAASSENLTKMASELIEIVSSGKVVIPLGGAYPLEEAAHVHRALQNRETTGSLVLIP